MRFCAVAFTKSSFRQFVASVVAGAGNGCDLPNYTSPCYNGGSVVNGGQSLAVGSSVKHIRTRFRSLVLAQSIPMTPQPTKSSKHLDTPNTTSATSHATAPETGEEQHCWTISAEMKQPQAGLGTWQRQARC